MARYPDSTKTSLEQRLRASARERWPQIASLQFGPTVLACHIVSALSYVIVAALGVALARTNRRGVAAMARCAVVVAVLAAPLVTTPGVANLLEAPQHIGTSAYLLGSFLLIDRAPGWRITAPLLWVILCAGQVGDATVLYVAVPAVLMMCLYRVLAARKIRSRDTAIAGGRRRICATGDAGPCGHAAPRRVRDGAGPDRDIAERGVVASREADRAGDPHPLRGGGRQPGHRARRRGRHVWLGLPGGRRVRVREGPADVAEGEPGRATAVRRDRGPRGTAARRWGTTPLRDLN